MLGLFTRVMIFAIAALALDLLVGYGALVSFGHAAFIGIGAYAVGILAAHGISDVLVALPVALAGRALFAFLTGIVCLRTKGVYFIMITLAFGQMAYFMASSLAPYGGDDGLTIRRAARSLGFPLLQERPRVLLRRAALSARRLSALPRAGRLRASAACCAARARTRSAWRRIGFDVYRFQLVGLCDRRRARRAVRFPARQRDRVRQPRLHVVAALGRTDHHGAARRARHACMARSSAPRPTC